MHTNYYGGGYIGNSLLDATAINRKAGFNILSRGATWPFYKLYVSKNNITLRTPWRTITKSYSQVTAISLEFPATITFRFHATEDNYGFIGIRPYGLLRQLAKSKTLPIHVNKRRLIFAQIFIVIYILLLITVLCIIVVGIVNTLK